MLDYSSTLFSIYELWFPRGSFTRHLGD
jgi:hypothetical protein